MFGNNGDMFGGLFDLNRDGKLDAEEFVLMHEIVFGAHHKSDNLGKDEESDEIENEGMDYEMDEEECREALEEAGLDPDDYDF